MFVVDPLSVLSLFLCIEYFVEPSYSRQSLSLAGKHLPVWAQVCGLPGLELCVGTSNTLQGLEMDSGALSGQSSTSLGGAAGHIVTPRWAYPT